MNRKSRTVGAIAAVLIATAGGPVLAQKQGGVLRLSHFDSPASMSILEESTRAALQPMMHVFNNLVMYKQDVAQTSPQTIVPDLATSWSWNEEGTELTFPLRQGVKWHDGKPFTAKDVKCTWELLTKLVIEFMFFYIPVQRSNAIERREIHCRLGRTRLSRQTR